MNVIIKKQFSMSKSKLYSLIFSITGAVIIIYSLFFRLFFINIDLGKRFNSKPFYESDLFFWVGLIWILIGGIYFLFFKMNKIQLIDKYTIKHYWFSIFFIIMLLIVPVLNKFYPTKEYRDSFIDNFFMFYSIISFFLFLIGFVLFVVNIIKSTYAYFLIKSKWEKD